jgi:hypothetical protein
MRPLHELPRIWPSIDLPGYRPHPVEYATYSGFALDELPPIERHLDDDLRWLLAEPPVPESIGELDRDATPPPARRATNEELSQLVARESVSLPRSFRTFIESLEPRRRVRSCTYCYLDLADFVVRVRGGGSLVHFLSDQQDVFHWLLYVGPYGGEAVVVSDRPLGYEADEGGETDAKAIFDPAAREAAVCADSFSEFLYRFWIENEIWYRLTDPESEPPLTDEQRRYAEHYG